MGRPIIWLVLQFLSIAICGFTVLLGVSWRNIPSLADHIENIRLGLPFIGGVLFIPWALHWKLLFLFV